MILSLTSSGNQGRFVHGGGRGEMNGRSSHGGHGGHGGGGYGNRGSFLPRDQTRASPTQPNQHFVSRNHKEIVDFFQQNFDLIKDQTVNVSGQKVVAGTSRKTIYYQPPPTPSPTVTPSKAGSYWVLINRAFRPHASHRIKRGENADPRKPPPPPSSLVITRWCWGRCIHHYLGMIPSNFQTVG